MTDEFDEVGETYREKFVPRSFQKKAILAGINNFNYLGLFMRPGLGKTSTILSLFKILRKLKKSKKMLVIAPLRVAYSAWPDEIEKWNTFSDMTFSIVHGRNPAERIKALERDVDCYLINPENVKWLFEYLEGIELKDFKKKLSPEPYKFDTLVIDESTKFKSPTAIRFKVLADVRNKFKRRYILSGTPQPNTLMDLWSQMYILDGGLRLGSTISSFRHSYFIAERMPQGFFKYEAKPGSAAVVYDLIKDCTITLDDKDYLEMPELTYNKVKVKLDPKVMKIYKQMEQEYMTILESGVSLDSPSAAAARNKCLQITSGAAYETFEPGEVQVNRKKQHHVIHDEKLDALVDLLTDIGPEPVLIAYHYKFNRLRIQERLVKEFPERFPDGTVPYVGSGMSAKKGKALEDKFNKGEISVLLGHPQSIAFGLNLQKLSRNVIWFTLTDSYETFDQYCRRVYRQGQKRAVVVHIIEAMATIDIAVFKNVTTKEFNQQDMYNTMKGLE